MIHQVLYLHCLKCKSQRYLKIKEKLPWFDHFILVLEDVSALKSHPTSVMAVCDTWLHFHYHVMLFCLSLYTHTHTSMHTSVFLTYANWGVSCNVWCHNRAAVTRAQRADPLLHKHTLAHTSPHFHLKA